jgi:hypothetical protein
MPTPSIHPLVMSGFNDEAMQVKLIGKLGGVGHKLALISNLVRR